MPGGCYPLRLATCPPGLLIPPLKPGRACVLPLSAALSPALAGHLCGELPRSMRPGRPLRPLLPPARAACAAAVYPPRDATILLNTAHRPVVRCWVPGGHFGPPPLMRGLWGVPRRELHGRPWRSLAAGRLRTLLPPSPPNGLARCPRVSVSPQKSCVPFQSSGPLRAQV